MDAQTRAAIEQALGLAIVEAKPLGGGDINEAYAVQLASGDRVFVKSRPGSHPDLFPTEAQGLDWLREPGVLRLPRVLAVSPAAAVAAGGPGYLVLELLERGSPQRTFDAQLGEGLALLHRSGAPSFGLNYDNFIGPLPQVNGTRTDWTGFWCDCRLEPMVRRARDAGHLTKALGTALDRLMARLPELLASTEPPSRLHGDLWAGNLHVDADGMPCLIDPAVYGGCREVDLAMMDLFGGFGPRVLDAYQSTWPLPAGWRERQSLYQLYPLLVHLVLFGGGYSGSVTRIVSRYA